MARGTFKTSQYGLRFFYRHTLGRAWGLFGKKRIGSPRQKRLPDALSEDQVRQLLGGIRNPVHKTCLAVMYACGLRISEATTLEVGAIDRANQVLRIVGKGNKERLVPLPQPVLDELGRLWRTHHNRRWLFPNRHGDAPLNNRVLSETFAAAAATAITFQLARAGAAPDSMLWAADRCHTDTAEIVTGLLAVPRINAR